MKLLPTTEFPEYILMAIHCAAAERVVLIKIKTEKKENSSVRLKPFKAF